MEKSRKKNETSKESKNSINKERANYNKLKKAIEKKQELIGMLESIAILGKYLPNEEYKSDYFSCKYSFSFKENNTIGAANDLAHQTFYKTFHKMLPELIKNDFMLQITEYNFKLERVESYIEDTNNDKSKREKLKIQYHNMLESFKNCSFNIANGKIDLIDFLTKNKMYEVVTNLLISEQVSEEQKFNILKKILENHYKGKFRFNKLLHTIPSTYMPHDYDNKEQEFNEKLFANLSKIREKYKMAENYFREFVKYNNILGYEYNTSPVELFDASSKLELKDTIMNLIKYNLVDIIPYEGEEITSAAVAYIYGKEDLALFLYELPSYKKIDSKIKDNTDILLLKRGNKDSKNGFDWLINRENFNNTCDKMLYILDFIDGSNSGKYCSGYKYTEEDINEIIDTLIRKTKKEDYKEVKRVLENRKRNQLIEEQKQFLEKQKQALLTQKRQEFTSLLRNLDDTLLETVPAKKKIKEINFQK